MPDVKLVESGFRGLDESKASETLPEGFLTRADHVILDHGEVRLRPGMVSQLSSVLPTAAYVLGSATDGTGNYLLIAANGKIRRWDWSANATSLPTGQGAIAITPEAVQSAQGFGLHWLTDGVNAPRSTNGTAVAALAGLDAPEAAKVELSHQALLMGLGALTWGQNTIPTAGNLIPYADRNIDTANWTFENGASSAATGAANVLDANRDSCVELDSKDERAISAVLVLPADFDAVGYARLAVIEFEAASEDTVASDVPSEVVDALVRSYSDAGGTTEITGSLQKWRSPLLKESQATKLRYLWDGRSLTTVPRAIKMILEQPFDRPGSIGADANHAAVYVPLQSLALADESGKLTVRQGSVQVWNSPDQPRVAGGVSAGLIGGDTAQSTGRLLTAGLQLRTEITAADWTGTDTLALEVSAAAGVTGLLLRVGLRSGGTIYWSQTLDTGLEENWGLADLRPIQKNLTAVDRIIVEIREDVIVDNLAEAGNASIMALGELRHPGNLATGRSYWYRLVELDSVSDATLLNVVESEGSSAIVEILPTYSQRRLSLRLPAKKNASATHLALYRLGGGLIDDTPGSQPLGRLVGIVPFASSSFAFGGNVATGTAPHLRAPANPYLGYTTGTPNILVDNTPDSWLFGAEMFRFGREKPPATPAHVALWNQRVWLGTDTEVFGSWLVDMQVPAALYWSRINLPADQDPHAAIKGFWVRLPLLAGDRIIKLFPRGESLLIFTKRGVWSLSGRDFTSYNLEQVSSFGLAALHGVCEHRGEIYYLTHDGLLKMTGRGVAQVSERVRLSLPPLSGATATAYAKSVLISTPNELLVSVPTNGASAGPDTVLCLGVRSDAWSKWPGLALTGGAQRPETPVAALALESGQIVLLTLGTGDGSGSTNITATVSTRPLGSREGVLRPHHIGIDANVDANQSLTLTVSGDDAGEAAGRAYQFNPKATARFRVSRCAVGRSLVMSVSAVTHGTFRLRRLSVEAIPFSRRN